MDADYPHTQPTDEESGAPDEFRTGSPADEVTGRGRGPHYVPVAKVTHARRKKRRWPWWTLIVVVAVTLAVAGFLLFGREKAAAPTATSKTVADQNTDQSPSVPTAPVATGTSAYTSPAGSLNLTFTYPSAWVVVPPSGQTGQTITLTSPIVNLTAAGGVSTPGRVVLTIQSGGSSVRELSGSATAAQDSVQYAYDAPTEAQHHYFYVSFLHSQTTASGINGAFELVVITGVNPLAKGTVVTADTFSGVDPLVTASFSKCTTQNCTGTGTTPLGTNAAAWQTDLTFKQLQALFESFKFN